MMYHTACLKKFQKSPISPASGPKMTVSPLTSFATKVVLWLNSISSFEWCMIYGNPDLFFFGTNLYRYELTMRKMERLHDQHHTSMSSTSSSSSYFFISHFFLTEPNKNSMYTYIYIEIQLHEHQILSLSRPLPFVFSSSPIVPIFLLSNVLFLYFKDIS